jgi:uncharacterized protein YndB with AHSA1/START domain
MAKERARNGTAGGIGNEAVRAKTGRGWDEWFRLLDEARGSAMDHTRLAAYIHDELGCPGWWSQAVAVAYEQARGLRQKHQKPDGFEASVSRTLAVSLETLFEAWNDEEERRRWLGEAPLVVRKATPGKTMRVRWEEGGAWQRVDVHFSAKGPGKSSVTVQHGRLPEAADVERVKAFWSEALERLKGALGG